MTKADANHHCAICGVKFADEGGMPWHHVCDPDVLDAIDRAEAEADGLATLDGRALLVGDLDDVAELEEEEGIVRKF